MAASHNRLRPGLVGLFNDWRDITARKTIVEYKAYEEGRVVIIIAIERKA